MMTKILLVTFCGLLASLGGLSSSPQEELLTFVQKEADWVSFHIWVPVSALEGLIPSGLSPAQMVFDLAEPSPPGTMVDAYLFIRSGTCQIPFGGKKVNEDIIDSFLAVAVKPGPADGNDGFFNLFLIEYYSNNQLFSTVLQQAGITPGHLEGIYNDTTLPNNNEMAEIEISAGEFKDWHVLARSTDYRHYGFARKAIRLFFSAKDELRTIEISLADDFYYRAASQLSNFTDNNPFDRWKDWRWAEKDTLIFYTRDSVHTMKKQGKLSP